MGATGPATDRPGTTVRHRSPGLVVPCRGGPNWMGWFRVDEPAPLELACRGGVYVLECTDPTGGATGEGLEGGDGHRSCGDHWYVFVADG